MPARSRSQQRLFGMVHAYNKGEFHGSRSLRNRIASLARHVSDDDAEHFAKTPHTGLPETKEAQAMLRPDELRNIYGSIPTGVYADMITPRSKKRRSILGRVFSGAAVGTALGGLGGGALGAFLTNKASQGTPGLSPWERSSRVQKAGLECGLWGAGRGAIAGAVTGLGLGILDKVRSE